MKKKLFMAALAALAATPGLAADMLVKKAPPPPRAPAWSWTGFYVGANLGGGWAKTDWFEDVSGSGGGAARLAFRMRRSVRQVYWAAAKSVLIGRAVGRYSASRPTPMLRAFAAV